MPASDGAALEDDDSVLRRFFGWMYVYDENLSRRRPSSAAMEHRPDESDLSCYVESLMQVHGLATDEVLFGHESMGLARATLLVLRSHGYDACPDPDGVDPNNPHPCDRAHGAIQEPHVSPSALRKRAGRLMKEAEVEVEPPEATWA